MRQDAASNNFDVNIYPVGKTRGIDWKELWRYRDMIILMIRRDLVATYKQSVLGPLWVVIQPLITTVITAFVFGNLAGLSPSGIPNYLFYMSAQVLWTFFSNSLNNVANTFPWHANLMQKVYFPRLAAPIATTLFCAISMLIHSAIFTVFYLGFVIAGNPVRPNWSLILVPIYILHLGLLAIGAGALLSSLTTKYRDLIILISFGITFWMYLSPIVYDFSVVPDKYRAVYLLNPTTPIFIQIRYALFNHGTPVWGHYAVSVGITLLLLIIGTRVFSRAERTFLDTI